MAEMLKQVILNLV